MIGTLPTELVEAIVDNIDSPLDVISLGLACKQFAEILAPKLDYFFISAPFTHYDIWNHLAEHPEDARHVRILHVVQKERLPRAFSQVSAKVHESSVDLVGEKFCKALGWMSDLRSVKWGNHESTPQFVGDGVWDVVKKSCPRLTELFVNELQTPVQMDLQLDIWRSCLHSEMLDLGNMTKFSMATDLGSTYLDTSALKDFLLRCPDLVTLELSFHHPRSTLVSLDEIFQQCHWPQLKVLSLGGVTCSDGSFATFISRHPTIHTIHETVHRTAFPWNVLEAGWLPGLREFMGPLEVLTSIAEAGSPLEVLLSAHVAPLKYEDPLGPALQRLSPTLRRIQLGATHSFCKGQSFEPVIRLVQEWAPDVRIELLRGDRLSFWVPTKGFVME
ncbi:hypothetical protein JAAARDRAFT_53961 [Jaapia argillacea MUCL 33604]|uniref:F-box domain-containing protein n=1 Tax=Jaapia argillacea MUCL 33604 TaxID=933084 RepID=A0A067QC82_9AGAM|nr:hypothetical protein JAAARDRAFT_53961 [Jaapia argillacea MUCL 33604]